MLKLTYILLKEQGRALSCRCDGKQSRGSDNCTFLYETCINQLFPPPRSLPQPLTLKKKKRKGRKEKAFRFWRFMKGIQ